MNIGAFDQEGKPVKASIKLKNQLPGKGLSLHQQNLAPALTEKAVEREVVRM